MTGQLDEISRLLGGIEAKQSIANSRQNEMSAKLDVIRREHSELLVVIREQNRRVDAIEKLIEEDVAPSIAEVNRFKQRGIGVLAAVGLLGTGLGAVSTKIIKLFP